MKKVFLALILLLTISCKKEEVSTTSTPDLNLGASSSTVNDDFSDLKKKEEDESCGTEKDIEKELIEQQKKKEFKLGGSSDCTIQ